MDEITLFATIAPPPPGDAEEIQQGARARLAAAMSSAPGPPRPARARRGPLALAGAAAAVAVAAGASAVLTVGGPSASHTAAAVHVNLAAWSVNTNPDGTVTVKTREVSQPRRLEHVLAEAGIPALVRWGELCRAPHGQYLPTRGIVDGPDYVGGVAPPVWIGGKPYPDDVWTFTPSRMPPGARYMITATPSRRDFHGGGNWTWGLIREGAHLTCHRPSAPPAGG
jgi:hypothetical protein